MGAPVVFFHLSPSLTLGCAFGPVSPARGETIRKGDKKNKKFKEYI